MKTFPIGGVHPSDNKEWSKAKAIETMDLPDVVTIPLAQHIGAPATAIVKKGDVVKVGQKIAEPTGFMSANIHAPISGTVTAVDLQPNGQGLRQMMITIKREGDEWSETIDRTDTLVTECNLEPKAIIEKNNDKINAMADLLLEKETIYAEDIETILGESAQSLKNKSRNNQQPVAATTSDKEDNDGVTIEPEPAISPATKDLANNI